MTLVQVQIMFCWGLLKREKKNMMAVFNITTQTLIWGIWILNCYIIRRAHYRGMVNSSIYVVDSTGEIVNSIYKQVQKQVKVYCKHKFFFFFRVSVIISI